MTPTSRAVCPNRISMIQDIINAAATEAYDDMLDSLDEFDPLY